MNQSIKIRKQITDSRFRTWKMYVFTKWGEGALENGKVCAREEGGLSWVHGTCSNPGDGRFN